MLRLAYLAATNAFTLVRLPPMSDRDKDIEILALRHQLRTPHRAVVQFGEQGGELARERRRLARPRPLPASEVHPPSRDRHGAGQ
ncbi:hypothetical protein ACFY3M_00095 [Streptomyces mirabilis]|uniref:hypothetical protein n=1 Tax=Streptomyces mirabilis TaxID=68239 RepID=UPI0036C2EBD7